MSDYLFIQSQDPFTETRTTQQFQLAQDLQKAGSNVTVLLVQNAVVPARKNAKAEGFDALLKSGVTVKAESLALAQREIHAEQLKPEISIAELDITVDALLAGHKVIWN